MPIGNIVQRGSSIRIYDENGRMTASIGCASPDELKGYTPHRINVRRGGAIHSYDAWGRLVSTVAAPGAPPPPAAEPEPAEPEPAPPPAVESPDPDAAPKPWAVHRLLRSNIGIFLLIAVPGLLAVNTYFNLRPEKVQPPEAGYGGTRPISAVVRTPAALPRNIPPPEPRIALPEPENPLLAQLQNPAPQKPRASAPQKPRNAASRPTSKPEQAASPTSANSERGTEKTGEAASLPDESAGLSWARATRDVDFQDRRIQKALVKALVSGRSVMWKADGRRGYMIPSGLQQETSARCRNLYETIISNGEQVTGPTATYCHDPVTHGWSRK